MNWLELPGVLEAVGFNGVESAVAIGSIIARRAEPGSEMATWQWLRERSALGELIDFNFESISPMRLYRISDLLVKHRGEIEKALFSNIRNLFSLTATVTLYDLTNTYFEGEMAQNPKARRGHSKEKRADCPLVTLGLVLDGSGFVRSSRMFDGNISEAQTLESMLKELEAPEDAMVIMDRGIATQVNVDWLVDHSYRYVVMSRERIRRFDDAQAVSISSAKVETKAGYRFGRSLPGNKGSPPFSNEGTVTPSMSENQRLPNYISKNSMMCSGCQPRLVGCAKWLFDK